MRIRKRKVPLPLSLLSPIPLSDPHLFSQSPVHLHHHHHHHQPHPSDYFSLTSAPSDLRPLIVVGSNTNPTSSGVKQEEEDRDEQQRSCLEIQGGGGERIAQKSNNDNDDGASKEEVEVDLELAVNNNGPVGVSRSNEGLGRWSGGDGVLIPLKKRRPSESLFEKDVYDNCEEQTVVAANGSTNSERDSNNKKGSGGSSTKQKRGTTIMEGSRCSRVNGRGWRCCQPTLVGYSLCEHHLGKGRLRSMTSVRGRPSSKKQHHMVKDNYRDHQDKHQATSKRANYKLGVVKARSLSSLLGQTASTTTTTSSNNNVGHGISSISNHESDAHVVALSTN